MALSNSAMTSSKAKKNNISLKANKVLEYVEVAGDVKTPNKYFNLSNGTSKGVCKEVSKGSYVNLPTRVGSFEISVNMPLASQLIPICDQYSSDSSSINSEKVNTNATVYAEKIPRSLSPDVFIKSFEKSSSVNKRKQRTPVKADLKSQVESPTSDIENPSINLNSSKTTCQKLDDNDQCGYYEQTKPIINQCNRSGKKGTKNNLDLKLSRPMSIKSDLVSAVLNSPVDSKLNKSVADIKSSKRKLQQTSKNFGSDPISKKQKKKMVKFHPNISEVIKPPVEEEMIDGSSKSSSQVSGKEVLDNSVLTLLHSRNVEVTFQNSKSVTSQKMPVSKKTLGSLSKVENNIKTFSQDKNEKMVTEFYPDLLEGTESEKEIASFTSSFHHSSKKFGYSMANNTLLNSVLDNVSNLSDSETFKMKATARMRTSKYRVKSILKKKALSPKSKSNRVTSNMLRENLQQYGLEENITSDDEPSPSINKGKPLSTTEKSDVTSNLHSSISTARMKTAKPSKGILKKKTISPKSKGNKVSSNMQSENLQQHGLEENVNSADETSPSVNKGKSSANFETSDILLSNVFNAGMKTAKINSKGILKKKAVSPKSKGKKVSLNIQSENLQQHGLAESVNTNDETSLSVNKGKSSSKMETSDITDNLLSNVSTTKRKTAKIPGKSILKKKAVSPNSKRNKVSSNIQSESLKHHGLEKDVNSDNETSLSINKGKSSLEIESSGMTDHLISNVSHNQSQILEEGSPTIALSHHNEGSPRKPIIRRGRPKSTKAKPSPLGRRKYSKKSSKRDLNVSTDTSENLEGSASDSDDNMPIISFLKSKAESLQEKSEYSTKVLDEENLLPGFNELLKNGKGKKKRGRGRKRQKIGSQKSKNMKEEIDADSSFVEEDDEEEQAIVPTAQSHAKRKHQKRTGRRYSVTGNWYIASGYLNDIMSLLEDFENCDGWRFKDFAKCWQKKSFSLVYRGRQTFKELLEFSEEIALLTMRFIGPSHSTKRRIGALYTLYGLYYKFPVGHFFNIRFELDEYKNLLELVQPFRSNIENPDPAYIFRKLELKGAILHCATACEPCYDFHNDERDLVDLEYGKQKLAKSSAVNIALPSIQLETDSELLTYYHSIKAKLTGQGSEPEPERALSLISSEFLSTIISDLSEMRKRTISILGMTPKALINTSTHGGEDSNQGDGTVSIKLPKDAMIVRDATKAIIDTVNKPEVIKKSQEFYQNIALMRDKSLNDFMRQPSSKWLSKPLELKVKRNISDVDKKPFNLSLPHGARKIKQMLNFKKNISRSTSIVPTPLLPKEMSSSQSSGNAAALEKKKKGSIKVSVALSSGGSENVVKIIEVELTRKKFQNIKKNPVKFINLKNDCKMMIMKSFDKEDFSMWHIKDIGLCDKQGIPELWKPSSKQQNSLLYAAAHKHGIYKSETSPANSQSGDDYEITIKEENFECDFGSGPCFLFDNEDQSKISRKLLDSVRSGVPNKNLLHDDNLVVQLSDGQFETSEVNNLSQKRGRGVNKNGPYVKGNKTNKENQLIQFHDNVAKSCEGNSIPWKSGRVRRKKKIFVGEETSGGGCIGDIDELIKNKKNEIDSHEVYIKSQKRKRGRPIDKMKSSMSKDASFGESVLVAEEKLSPQKVGRPSGRRKTSGENTLNDSYQLNELNENDAVSSIENSSKRQRGRPRGSQKFLSTRDTSGENTLNDSYQLNELNVKDAVSSIENSSKRQRGRPRGSKKFLSTRDTSGEDTQNGPNQLNESNGKEVVSSIENSYLRRRETPISSSKNSVVEEDLFDEEDEVMEKANETSDDDYSPEKMERSSRKKKALFSRDSDSDNDNLSSTKHIPKIIDDGYRITGPKSKQKKQSVLLSPLSVGGKIIYHYTWDAAMKSGDDEETPKKSNNNFHSVPNKCAPLNINDELNSHLLFSPENAKKNQFLLPVPSDGNDSNQFAKSENNRRNLNKSGKDYVECKYEVTNEPEISDETTIVEVAANYRDDCQKRVLDTFEFQSLSSENKFDLHVDEEDINNLPELTTREELANSCSGIAPQHLANTVKVLSDDWSDNESIDSKVTDSYFQSDYALSASHLVSVLPVNETVSIKEKFENKDVGYTSEQFSISDGCDLNTQTDQEDLFCKVMSSDGNSVLVPLSVLSQVNTNCIEILSVNSVDLQLLASPQNVENLQLDLNKDMPDKSSTNESWYSRCPSAAHSQPTSYPQMSQFPPKSLTYINPPASFPTYTVNSLENHSELTIPIPESSGTLSCKLSKSFKPPLLPASSPKCSFLFSSKLKLLSNKKLASGRPPSPPPKPRVKFMFKGKNWQKKN